MPQLDFQNPYILLLILPVVFLFWLSRKRRGASIRFSSLGFIGSEGRKPSRRVVLYPLLNILKLIIIVVIIVALARPRFGRQEEKIYTEGVDIMLVFDVSSSMKAEDFKPKNRIEAAKVVAEEFIEGRTNDQIGLVVFAAKSFTQCPLTIDYGIVINFLKQTYIGMIEDGTAIGTAIGTAVNRLRHSKAKSKVIVLLTDGINNRGEIDPITAAKLAKAMNIKIYTIGMGKRGYALYPVEDPIFGKRYVKMPVEIDEKTLGQVASITGGQYFRATDENKLREIYKQIDEMEKTKIEVQKFVRYKELFPQLIGLAAILLFILFILENTYLRKLP